MATDSSALPNAMSREQLEAAPFWHPFSNMASAPGERVVLAEGRGCELVDIDGKRYLDATACLWYCAIGHGRAEMAAAIAEQAERLAACSCFDLFASERTLELSARLARMAPLDDPLVFLTSGGSDSIDTAAKISRRYWSELGRPHKQIIVSREGAYHGTHAYGTSLGGIPANRDGFGPLVAETATVARMDASALASEIDRVGSDRVAAFLAEPVQGAGGVHPAPDDYFAAVAEVCAARDVLLVIDEVITGFGRTGHVFASERYGIRPDILITAKALTSGYAPLGAVLCSAKVADPFRRPGSTAWLRHGYTYSGHPMCCAAALANLDIIEEERLVERAAEWEPEFRRTVLKLEHQPNVAEVRTLGLLAGIQIAPSLAAEDPTVARRADAECRRRGVLTRPLAGDTLLICPSLVMEQSQLERIVEAMGDAIAAVA